MKKYTKPMIVFESFTLSTNIAGDCDVKTNLPTNETCGMDFSGYAVFMDGMEGCGDFPISTTPDGEGYFSTGPNNTICYHTFEGKNLFNS